MLLSKEDAFCEAQTPTNTSNATTVSTNVLDFHAHGDDILRRLNLVVQCTTAGVGTDGALAIAWETCAAEDFGSNVESKPITTTALGKNELTKGAYVVKNMPLPQGLKRYNRLKFTNGATVWATTAPAVSAFLVDGRVEPLK